MPLLIAEQGSPEWHAHRAKRITASLAGAILGVDPYKGWLAAWTEITGRHKQEDNKHMAWGREFEGQARAAYECLSGHFVEPTGFWVHPDHDWLGASPDGLIGDEGLVEIKCPSKVPEAIPPHHRIQMLIQMACTGREWCDYYAWAKTDEFCRRVEMDIDEEEKIIKQLKEFYRTYILTDTAPPRRRPKEEQI